MEQQKPGRRGAQERGWSGLSSRRLRLVPGAPVGLPLLTGKWGKGEVHTLFLKPSVTGGHSVRRPQPWARDTSLELLSREKVYISRAS